jgi:putative transposase
MKAGGFYHVYNIGNNRETIFKEDCNYDFFLRRLQFYVGGLVHIHAYCLMPNHFHLLIEVPLENEHLTVPSGKSGMSHIKKAFKNFFISYAKSINKAYDRLGSLFKTKCPFKPVHDDFQYRTTIAYIHYNPIKAGLCESYDQWEYSSFLFHKNQEPSLADKVRVLKEFGNLEEFLNFHERYQKLKNPDF